MINALEDNFVRLDTDTDIEVSVKGEDGEYVTVAKNHVKTAKLKNTDVHPSSILDVIEVGTEKMEKINLPIQKTCKRENCTG